MTDPEPGLSTEWLAILPWFVPTVLLAFGVAAVAGQGLARILQVRPVVAVLLIVCSGAILGATLTPVGIATEPSQPGSCDFSKLWPELDQLRRLNDESLNVILFVPLGATVALVHGGRAFAYVLGAALLFPVAIEGVQAVVPALDRGCQSGDVVDNVSGLIVGLALTGVPRALLRMRQAERE